MRDKTASTLLIGFIGLALALIPQAAFVNAGDAEGHLKLLTRELKLTPAQARQVYPLLEDEEQVVHQKKEETQQRIAALLNGDQQKKFGKMIGKRDKRREKQETLPQRQSLP